RAVNNDDSFEATRFLERALEQDPEAREVYANLFLLYKTAGNKQAAVESIVRYLQHFPDDKAVKEELRKYRETGEFDLKKTFGVPG
ncbi:MAG: tetratricopeptide repeat protein, partial [Gemmatimonadota bacterium]|nr:tetratricopeptide repeat protein [Gemmatimonadota bacterium]